MTKHLSQTLVPQLLDSTSSLSKAMSLLIRVYPQPWHATSTLVCEAAVGFGLTHPEPKLWFAYFLRLMEEQDKWFDRPSADKTPEQIRNELAVVAGEVLESQGAKGPASKLVADVRDKITFKTTPNGGWVDSHRG